MKNFKFNLQLFGEGGGSGAGAAAGATAATEGSGAETALNSGVAEPQEGDLSNIIYGKSNNEPQAQTVDNTTKSTSVEDKAKTFENMIKKGGEYSKEFNDYTQKIIDKRFKQTKEYESRLSQIDPILDTLSTKYGIDVSDVEGLAKAIAEDDSLFEEAAFKEGLTTKQYREKVALERENERLRAAEQQAMQEQHSNEIFKGWMDKAEEMKTRYGLTNFDFQTELENPEFTSLLANGVDFEAAYKAVHFDDMLGGAMAQTAANVEQALVQNVISRHSRPSENGTQSSTGTNFKPDVNKWTDADVDEVIKRVHRGDRIQL